jgi:hypothetical protein
MTLQQRLCVEIIRERFSYCGISDDSDWAMKISCAARQIPCLRQREPGCNIEDFADTVTLQLTLANRMAAPAALVIC